MQEFLVGGGGGLNSTRYLETVLQLMTSISRHFASLCVAFHSFSLFDCLILTG